MLGKIAFASVLLVLWLVVGATKVFAQDADNSITGYWEQPAESIYIKITEVDGVLLAEMIRNDWNPLLVGKTIWRNLKSDDGKKWTGDLLINNAGEDLLADGNATIAITLRRGDQISSMEKPGKRRRTKWKRSAPVKKGY